MGLIHVGKVNRRRHGTYDDPGHSHRQATIHYTVPDGTGNVIEVCKKNFMNIFAVTRKRLYTIINKKKKGDTTFTDKRTRTCPSKFTDNDILNIRKHVNSIPRDESHYSRAKSTKEFLSPDLNVFRLHKAFKEQHPESLVTYRFYRRIFLKYFPNLSFRQPRTDTCKTCDRLNCEIQAKNEGSILAKQKLELHHRKVQTATSSMKTDVLQCQEPNSPTSVISIDLEQVLFVPTLTHSDMFYLSQLSCYNLCIHLADNKKSYMCFWHEGFAGRGGNEISSCLLRVLNMGITNKNNLIVWSDNCAAQNKNRMMVFVYCFLIACGIFETIEHKFLVSGHSFLQCDRDFALIEKRKRKVKAMVPEDLKDIILSSSHTGRFEVVDMCERFFNTQSSADTIINLKNVNISKVVHLKLDKNNPGVLFSKESFSEVAPWKKTNILKKGKRPSDLNNIELLALPNENKITENKKKHLLSMIPYLENAEHQLFYKKLLNIE